MDQKGLTMILVTSQDWGGVQAYVLDLALALKSRGLPVIVCAGRPEKLEVRSLKLDVGRELGDKCLEAGIEFIELKRMIRDINPISNTRALFELISLFKKHQPHTVHLNSSMMGAVGSLAARIAGIQRVVYCIGGWAFNEQISSWKKSLYITIEKISARWKDVIICVHPGDEKLALDIKIKPREKVMTIPNGIDVNLFQSQLRDRETAHSLLAERCTMYDVRCTVVGTVANSYPPKNLFWYLEVCKTITDKHPDFKFVIIGDGPQFEELKAKHASLNLQDKVILTGRFESKLLYTAFDISVLPSTKEGMPLAVLESMAAKVPCVVTDVGGCRWMLQDEQGSAGLVIPPNDDKALEQAIEKLASNSLLRQELSQRAYNLVTEKFNLQDTLNKTIETL
ncbi:MAG: glycosyltransferase family 4 protein [Patescibacteria group bacterium]